MHQIASSFGKGLEEDRKVQLEDILSGSTTDEDEIISRSSDEDVILDNRTIPTEPMPGAYYALFIVSTLNMLNMADRSLKQLFLSDWVRYMPAALKDMIKADFNWTDPNGGLTDAETGKKS